MENLNLFILYIEIFENILEKLKLIYPFFFKCCY